jgi:hypothetical protein
MLQILLAVQVIMWMLVALVGATVILVLAKTAGTVVRAFRGEQA